MRKIKKYSKGEASHYISRAQALRKLQLSLNDFRRLCIIKGVYPREPKNRRKAQKGNTSEIKILYHAKDIRFLAHEPIVWTLRDYKIFNRRTGRDRAVRDFRNLKRRLENTPQLKLDHIVKERYPSFIDAIKDLDDCLTLLFLFSTFPSLDKIPRDQSALCRRLTVEFMHAVIAEKSLRKAFISIKGYYFQAEIKGQKVTWIVPHYYPFQPQKRTEVDFKLMSIFVEFYTIMLGFVNFRLYHSLNLLYPPTFPDSVTETESSKLQDESAFVSDRIAALNIDLLKTDATTAIEEEETEIDLELLTNDGDSAKINQLKDEMQQVGNLKKLFSGLYFYISREVPREPLVFMIRCFGGKVSWDETLFAGSSFKEDDERITHQIVDRPLLGKQYISRDYVQPQWIFDSVNQCKLLPTNKYFIGVDLPPHLSPFYDYVINEKEDEDEDQDIHDPKLIDTNTEIEQRLEKAFQEEQDEEEEKETEAKDSDETDSEVDEKTKIVKEKKKNMKVVSGVVHTENPEEVKADELQERHLKAKMVKGQHRFLFKKLLKEKREKQKEERILQQKRKAIADEQKVKRIKVAGN